MSVTVTSTAPGLFGPVRVDRQHPDGESFHVDEAGRLLVESELVEVVAMYAPGQWSLAAVDPDQPAVDDDQVDGEDDDQVDEEPWLGLATTGELLDELRTRIEVHGPGLGYRTVDGD